MNSSSLAIVTASLSYWLYFHAAFDNVFEKFDLSGDGTISIEEYKTLCEEYGVTLTQEDITAVRRITDDGGEVRRKWQIISTKLVVDRDKPRNF